MQLKGADGSVKVDEFTEVLTTLVFAGDLCLPLWRGGAIAMPDHDRPVNTDQPIHNWLQPVQAKIP